MWFRRAHFVTLLFCFSVGGLGMISYSVLGTHLVSFAPLAALQRTIGAYWPWKGDAALGPPTVLARGVDRARIATLPYITRTGEGDKSTVHGTGFFISADGTVLTAAHLVKDCQTIRVASHYLASTVATRVASDNAIDAALLMVPSRPPAVLGIAAPPAAGARLTTFGYPGGGDSLSATEAPGAQWRDQNSDQADKPLQLLRVDSPAIRAGFSGGPVVGPPGDVIGMIRGGIVIKDPANGAATTPSGIAVGPGAGTLAAFVTRVSPLLKMTDVAARHASGGDVKDIARRAVVHVSCSR
jgi:S1-C subfamily serine protease